MSTTEQQAHDDVLRLCGETPPGGWVMREQPANPLPGYQWKARYRVINLSRGTVAPYREIVAEADTWVDVLDLLSTGEQS